MAVFNKSLSVYLDLNQSSQCHTLLFYKAHFLKVVLTLLGNKMTTINNLNKKGFNIKAGPTVKTFFHTFFIYVYIYIFVHVFVPYLPHSDNCEGVGYEATCLGVETSLYFFWKTFL